MKRLLSLCIFWAAVSPLTFTLAQSGNNQRKSGTTETTKLADRDGLNGKETASAEKRGQGDKDSAPEATRVAGVDNKTEAKKYYDAGIALVGAGKFDKAIPKLKQSVKLEPTDAQSHYGLGIAYFNAKKFVEAADSFKRAARLKPDWAEAHFQLCRVSYVLGRRAQAESEYQQLQSMNPTLANALDNIMKGTSTDAANDKPNKPAAAQIPSATPARENQNNAGVSAPGNSTKSTTSAPVSNPTISPTTDPNNALMNIYRVGVGDVLDIRILNSPTTASTLYTVIEGGLIEFPLVGGSLAVAGLTAGEIQNLLAAELKRRSVQEKGTLNVGVRQYASHTVVVSGLVNAPGTKMLRREAVPLYVVLAEAQPRLEAARVTVMRAGAAAFAAEIADQRSLNFPIRSGDVIIIMGRAPEFYYISGVLYPGEKNYQPGITLLQAILAAGGLARAYDNTVEISRENGDGWLATTKYSLKEIKAGKVQDPRLQPGDRIVVWR